MAHQEEFWYTCYQLLCEIGILTKNKAHYWDVIAATWQESSPQKLWRKHSDEVNINLFSDWLPSGSAERLLKTDLFDEAVSQGLYPFLSKHSRAVHGIDIGTESVAEAKNRFPNLQASCADVRYLPFNDHFLTWWYPIPHSIIFEAGTKLTRRWTNCSAC